MSGLAELLERPMTPPDPVVAAAVASGPIDPADALRPAQIGRLTDPEPLAVETGWCTLPDGVAYAAVRTPMPGVTGEMVDWWFDWHQRESVRYRIWFPGAHESISFDPPRTPGAKPFWGAVHYPVEDVGLGMDKLWIAFKRPSEIGFMTDGLEDPNVATIVGGYVGDRKRHVQHTLMCHVFLREGDGLVQRSRFWIGGAIRPRIANRRIVRRLTVPKRAPKVMAEHCAAEYANLAALLPELHARYS